MTAGNTLEKQLMSVVRSYDHERHFEQLKYICRDVYGGTDYLPNAVDKLAVDEECHLIVLEGTVGEEEQPSLQSIGNIRRLDSESHFLEAIRVHEDVRGQGLATRMVEELVSAAFTTKKAKRVITCTIQENEAMCKIFGRLGFRQLAVVPTANLEVMREIQSKDEAAGADEVRPSLSEALGLEESVAAKKLIDSFVCVTDFDAFLSAFSTLGGCKSAFGDTLFVGFYNAVPVALAHEDVSKGTAYIAYSEEGQALGMVVFKDDPQITSLYSKTVCTIVARTNDILEACFLFACKKRHRFAFVVDCAAPVHERIEWPFYKKLPLSPYRALIFEKLLDEKEVCA